MDYAVYFGRFSEEKGIRTLIKVCKELPDVQFIFAGIGPLEDSIKGVANIRMLASEGRGTRKTYPGNTVLYLPV